MQIFSQRMECRVPHVSTRYCIEKLYNLAHSQPKICVRDNAFIPFSAVFPLEFLIITFKKARLNTGLRIIQKIGFLVGFTNEQPACEPNSRSQEQLELFHAQAGRQQKSILY